MPLYEYDCSACGKSFEILQKLEDPAPESCQICTGGPVHKRMSRTGFILKGGGWYVTDFRGGGNNPAGQSEGAKSSSDSSGASSDATPAESKPADSKPAESKVESKPST